MHKKIQVVVIVKECPSFRVLLLRTNRKRGGEWQNITGGVQGDEILMQGACRELLEETGIGQIDLIDLQNSIEFTDRRGKEVQEHCFLCLLQEKPSIILSEEHQEFRWEDLEKIDSTYYGNISNFQVFNLAKKKIEK